MALATYALFAPSAAKLYANYSLIGLTVGTGTYLVVSKPAHMLETCTMGLLYLSFTLAATFVTRRKLAAQRVRIRRDDSL